MRVLGLDPGLQRTGWGVIERHGNGLRFRAAGVVATVPGDDLATRLDALYRGLKEIVARERPDVAAVEETVVNVNGAASLKLGHARGVVLLAAAHAGLAVSEYAAKTVKRAVVGTGSADKRQVAMMVRMLLPGSGELGGDAADALAVALCHTQHHDAHIRLAAAVARAGAAGGLPR
jgi:crossover junction endodeoxyribonuclease RuvC